MKISMKTEGLAALEKKLVKLPTAVSVKIMSSALLFALTPIRKAAIGKVAKFSGQIKRYKRKKYGGGYTHTEEGGALAKSITKKSFSNKSGGFRAEAGIVMSTRRRGAGYRWHLLEFGTSNQKAQPFLRPAWDANVRKAVERFEKKMSKSIAKLAKVGK